MSEKMKLEIYFGEELVECEISKELFNEIEKYSAEVGQSIEESITQAILHELDKEIGDEYEKE